MESSSIDSESLVLLNRWKAGDRQAAEEIFTRYVQRLTALARMRLSERMQRRVDADDVVQSTYRTFFRHARSGRYELKQSGDLWRLLAAITIRKSLGQVEYHQAEKRSIDREVEWPNDDSSLLPPQLIARDPTAEEAVTLTDEVQAFMCTLTPLERKVLELRLQDHSSQSIAEEVEYSPRTVRRTLRRLKSLLVERMQKRYGS